MKNSIYIISLALLLISSSALAGGGSYFGYARERGIIITVTPDKYKIVNGEKVKFSGTIKAYGKNSGHLFANNGYSLLKEFEKAGMNITASFPSEATDISDSLILTSSKNDEIKFSFQSYNINAVDLNQFSIKVFNNKQDSKKIARLSQIKAKLERRLLPLEQLRNRSRHERWSAKAVALVEAQIAYLNTLIEKIKVNMNADENLVADYTHSLQIDNLKSNPSRISTIMNKYRFVITSEMGTAIEGMQTKFKAVITNLRKAGEGDDDDSDEIKAAQFKFNGQLLYTSASQNLSGGKSITYEYTTSKLKTSDDNNFEIALYDFYRNKLRNRVGWLDLDISVLDDTVKPVWLVQEFNPPDAELIYVKASPTILLKVKDDFGRIDPATFSAVLTGLSVNQNVSALFVKSKIGEGESYAFGGILPDQADGEYALTASVKDFGQNTALPRNYNLRFRLDKTLPVISFNIPADTITNSTSYSFPVSVDDASPITTEVFVNDELKLTSTEASFDAAISLNLEGENKIYVISTDAAGNKATSSVKTVVRDTIAPVLSDLLPVSGSELYQMLVNISGKSNEKLKYVKVGSQIFNLSLDKLSFTGDYLAEQPGNINLIIEFSDMAGNVGIQPLSFTINNKLLNAALITVIASASGLKIVGSEYASRPNVKVKASSGFFGFNNDQTTSNSNGSFALNLSMFESATITATDLQTGESESATIYFDATQTKLSGIVKDNNNNPLPNVTVQVSGSAQQYLTDANGVFNISNPPTGDQDLIVNGSTVPQTATGPNKSFYTTHLALSIGIGKNNVLERPIYLIPLLKDGSETIVSANSAVTVTSHHAPGVELIVPAGTAVFNDGGSVGSINIMKIDSEFSTILPPINASPKYVYSFEPSGLSFKQRVQLILPNENELPPGVELLIYSMNSAKGAWEVDGMAVVSENGQSVVTKPGHGISHFSLVYAVPLSPFLGEVKNPNLLGVDASQGGVTTTISAPSYKSLGKDISPSLMYNSAWANPTAVTTNIIDIPEMKSEITGVFNNTKFEYKNYRRLKCRVKNPDNPVLTPPNNVPEMICEEGDDQYLLGLYSTFTGTIKSWYEPEEIKGQFFVSNIGTNEAPFLYRADSDQYLEGSNFYNVMSSKITPFKGQDIPRRSLASFGVELYNSDTNEYLKSGIYPTLTRYQIKLKNITLMTGTNITHVTVDGHPYTVVRTIINNQANSKVMENSIPKDISSNVLVQSKVNSQYGRGWDFAGVQKIVNPESDKVMISNGDGSVSTYALNNTISTLVNANGTSIDISVADLSQWPNAVVQRSIGSQVYAANIDLSTGISSLTNEGLLNKESGIISSEGIYQCIVPSGCSTTAPISGCTAGVDNDFVLKAKYTPIQYSYNVKPSAAGFTRSTDGRILGLDIKQHSLFQIYQGNYYKLAGMKTNILTHLKASTGSERFDLNADQINSLCNNVFGSSCTFIKNETEKTTHCAGARHLRSNGYDVNWVFTGTWRYCPNSNFSLDCSDPELGQYTKQYCDSRLRFVGECTFDGYYFGSRGIPNIPLGHFSGNIGIAGFSGYESQGGVATNPTAIGLNNPKAIITSPEGHFVVADTGNNRVRKFNLTDNSVVTIAGNGGTGDTGDGGAANNAEIFHPQDLAYDGLGNLFISSESGYIRKVDSTGKITHFAGLPLSSGGILSDNAHADVIALNNPSGMVVDIVNNFLYVADTGNHRVLQIDLVTKNTRVVAGTGACDATGLTNGSAALLASLCSPTKVGLDADKNLIIADSGHGLIRKVNLNHVSSGDANYLASNKDMSKLVKNSDGSWTRTYRNGITAEFNSLGNQTSIVDRVGRRVNYIYNSDQQLTQITNVTTGQTTELRYSGDKLSSIKDPANRETNFNYSGNLLSSVDFPDGSSRRYEYNEKGMLLKEFNERNLPTTYAYNSYNRLKSVTHPDSSVVNIDDLATQSANNSQNSSIQLKNAGYGPTQISDRVVDARGIETEFTTDFMGTITSVKDAEGKITKIEKDIEGKTTKIIHPDETIVEFVYNELTNDLISTKNLTLNLTQSQQYNQYGQLISATNANNQTSINTYDPITGLLAKQTASDGSYVDYTYNAKGLVQSKVVNNGASSITTSYEYDSFGNLTKQTDNSGKSIRFINDLAGNALQSITSTDGTNQIITTKTYDLFNKLQSVKSPKNEITSYEYLPTGQLTKITDPNSNETIFEYDVKGRLAKKITPEGYEYQFAYDANNNKTQEIDPNGNIKNYEYNSLNLLAKAQLPDDTIVYTYDIRDQVASVQNNVSAINYVKDVKGRVTQLRSFGLGQLSNFPDVIQQYDYDNIDNLLSMQSAYGNFNYTYDSANRLTSVSNSFGDSFGFDYDSASRITKVSRPGGYTNFTYNSSSGLESISHYSSGNILRSFANYEYDQRNYQTIKRTPAGDFNFSYDGNGQLTSATNPYGKNESFSYDSLGNRTTDDQGSFAYDVKKQRLESDYQYNYFYDNNGNLIRKYPKDTTKTAYKYTYSSSNQLVKIEVLKDILGQITKTVEFKYDVLGRRIQKSVVDVDDNSKSFTKRYLYYGSNIYAELDGSNNVLASYTHSPLRPDDIMSANVSSAGVTAGLAQASGKYYYLKDLLGSVTDIANAAGLVVQKYEYSIYGKIFAVRDSLGNDISTSPVLATSFTFAGREFDTEGGMYYNRARYYDANTGRFMQQDPHPGSLSQPTTFSGKYNYGLNNPGMFTDPSGHAWFVPILIGGLISGAVGGAISAYISGETGIDFIISVAKGALGGLAQSAIVVAAISLGGGALILGTAKGLLYGMAGGALGGALVGAALTPSNPLLGAAVGMAFGALGGALAGATPLPATQTLKDAAVDSVIGVSTGAPPLEGPAVYYRPQIPIADPFYGIMVSPIIPPLTNPIPSPLWFEQAPVRMIKP